MKVSLDIKNERGEYLERTKTFRNKAHLFNYIRFIMREYGEKVIGEHYLTD